MYLNDENILDFFRQLMQAGWHFEIQGNFIVGFHQDLDLILGDLKHGIQEK